MWRLKQWMWRAALPLQSRVVILMYHRVFEAESDPWGLCVSPKHFAEHLEHLRQHYLVMSLRKLVRSLTDGKFPKRGVVLTFDDGYADNLWNAKPLLERYDVPATVFVATGYLGQEREFWWDELERLVLLTSPMTQRLQVTLNGASYEWDLDEWARLPMAGKASHPQWRAFLSDDPTPRHRAYRDLHRLLRPLGLGEQDAILATLRLQAKCDREGRSGYRALTRDEVCQLADGGLIDIGAHTVTHPVLATQTLAVQRSEMADSKSTLESLLGQPVTTLSYPYGGPSDVGEKTVRIAREVGFQAACANVHERVSRGVDLCWLPRFVVQNWTGDEFARQLRMMFSG